MTTWHGTRSIERDPYAPWEPDGPLIPFWRVVEEYGAIGDGASHPAGATLGLRTLDDLRQWNNGQFAFADAVTNEVDYLAIQAALRSGGRVLGRSGAAYVLNHTLTWIVGMSFPDFGSASLDFSGMAAQTSATNLVANPTFAGGTGWSNTTLPHTDFVFGAGAATFTDPAPGTAPSFGQAGQQITIPAGRWRAQITIAITPGASAGQYGIPYCGLGFFGSGVGLGASAIVASVTRSGTFTGTVDIWFDFELAAETVAWFVFTAGNGNVVVTAPLLTPFFLNCAVWATGDGWSGGRQGNSGWRGGKLIGPGHTAGVAGFLVKSFTGAQHQPSWDDVTIGDRGFIDLGGANRGFSGGIVFSDIAFLTAIRGGSIDYCDPGVQFLAGSINAGENMKIIGTTIANGGTCLDVRGGGEWNLYGVSMDYMIDGYPFITADNGAVVNLHGVHMESNPSSDTMIRLAGGSVINMPTGEFFQGGTDACSSLHYVELADSNCKLLMGDVSAYNMQTASGDWATGPGVIMARSFAVRGGNSLLFDMVLRNLQMDAFAGNGGLPDLSGIGFYGTPADGIGFAADLFTDSGTPTSRLVVPLAAQVTRDTVFKRSGAGSLKVERLGAYTGGIGLSVYYPVREGQIAFDELYYGQPQALAPFNAGAPSALSGAIATTAGSAIATFTDAGAEYLNGSGPRPGWNAVITGAAAVGGVAAGSINGTRPIIARTGSHTWTVALGAVAASTATGGGAGIAVQYQQTSVRIYSRRFWMEAAGYDAYGRALRKQALFAGEVDFDIKLTVAQWERQQMSTWYSEPQAPVDPMSRYGNGRAPAWATHMMIQLDCQNIIPAGVSAGVAIPVHFADLFANRL